MTKCRFENLPDKMKSLPIDERGFPVPWFVAWFEGSPDFRIAEERKLYQAIKFDKCWVCGGKLGKYKAFVIGPMCGINRTISDPPSHKEQS